MGYLLALFLGALGIGLSSGSSDDSFGGSNNQPDPTPDDTDDTSDGNGGASGEGGGTPAVPDDAYDIGWAGLTAEEQMMVELVNRARMDPQAEVIRLDEPLANGIASNAVQPLAVTQPLSAAARDHSEDMDDRDFFSHTNPDGDSPGDRAIDAGNGSAFVGENIGWIGSSAAPDPQARVEAHHENLWDSDGHQANLMRENWSEIGMGYDEGAYQGLDHSTFVTELFGDRDETYLTGVVIDDTDGDDFYDIGEGQGAVRVTAYAGDDAYATATWAAGGYSLALPSGTYRVVFEGGDLDRPYETQVTIGNENVKLDVIEDSGAVLASLEAAPVDTASDGGTLSASPGTATETVAGLEMPLPVRMDCHGVDIEKTVPMDVEDEPGFLALV